MVDDANSRARATNNLAVATLAAALIQVRQDGSRQAVSAAMTEARELLMPRRTPDMYSRSTDRMPQ